MLPWNNTLASLKAPMKEVVAGRSAPGKTVALATFPIWYLGKVLAAAAAGVGVLVAYAAPFWFSPIATALVLGGALGYDAADVHIAVNLATFFVTFVFGAKVVTPHVVWLSLKLIGKNVPRTKYQYQFLVILFVFLGCVKRSGQGDSDGGWSNGYVTGLSQSSD